MARFRPATATLVIATLGLGAALLIPVAFSDPNGVDPYDARLGGAALLTAVAGLLIGRLAPARAILLALASVATTYTILAAGPQILFDLFGARSGGFDQQELWASVAQTVLTLAIAALTLRVVAPAWRPALRMRASTRGLVAGIAGSGLLVGLGIALPAAWLGRVGLAPVAILRDLPWLGPANGLQGFSQEVQFRGLLLGALEATLSPRWANVAQAAVFGLAHLAISYGGPEAPFVPITFLVGIGFGWLVQRYNSIWPAVIIHAAADIALQFAVVPGLYGF